MCIKDKNKIKFQGNPENSLKQIIPLLWFEICNNKEHCKTENEIKSFASNIYIEFVMKASEYDPNRFDEDPVQDILQRYVY